MIGSPFEERELMSQLKYEQGRECEQLGVDCSAPPPLHCTADAPSHDASSRAPSHEPRPAPVGAGAIHGEPRPAAPPGGAVEFGTGEAPPLAPPRAWAREELDEWLQQPEQVCTCPTQ